MRATFNELAERELNDAAQYYEHEQAGLGAAFITEVRRCTAAIAEHPEAGTLVQGAIRRRLCQRFPVQGCGKRVAHSRSHEPQTPSRVLDRQDLTDGPTPRAAVGARWDDGARRG